VKVKNILASILVLVICFTGIFAGSCNSISGALPKFTIGDTWVSKWHTGGQDYTVTSIITGEDTINGKSCWVMETSYDPAYLGQVLSTTNKYYKDSLDIVFIEYHTNTSQTTTITYQVSGTAYYPLEVGKESKEIDIETITTGDSMITQTENVTVITTTKVEKIETITVPAGTFKCFKVLKYDESGNLIQTTWKSDKTKLFQVKIDDPTEIDSSYELISYSVK
jgi:hypothetical protein